MVVLQRWAAPYAEEPASLSGQTLYHDLATAKRAVTAALKQDVTGYPVYYMASTGHCWPNMAGRVVIDRYQQADPETPD